MINGGVEGGLQPSNTNSEIRQISDYKKYTDLMELQRGPWKRVYR